jgi:AraC-like DNA-binding protein/mannose-6-phosphate isomerase-like protein (cupin superfamily)
MIGELLMKITPHVCYKSGLMLNEYANHLKGDPASFHVHYWGGKPRHFGNVIHRHAFFEICYVAEGEGFYIHEGVKYDLQPGTLYCSKPGSEHYIESTDGMLLLFVAFEMLESESNNEMLQICNKLKMRDYLFSPNMEQSPPVWLWKALMLHAAESEEYMIPVIKQLSHNLLVSLLSHFSKHQNIIVALTNDHDEELRLSQHLREAKSYVQLNLSKKWTLKEIAQKLHISDRQLSRLYSEELGQTFPLWMRIERTKSLLAYTDLSIKEIALQTGFDTVHYFNRVFQETLGTPPGQFRKEMHNHQLDIGTIHRYLKTIIQPHKTFKP